MSKAPTDADLPAEPAYASQPWWERFWQSASPWGGARAGVLELYRAMLDRNGGRISIVDFGAGDGRNSLAVASLPELKQGVVHAYDWSPVALDSIRAFADGCPTLDAVGHRCDVNGTVELPDAVDVVLLYGILEYVTDTRLPALLDQCVRALRPGGLLLVVTLVDGPGVFESPQEPVRDRDALLKTLCQPAGLELLGHQVDTKDDLHDIGNGYPEPHRHYVFRATFVRGPSPADWSARLRDCGR